MTYWEMYLFTRLDIINTTAIALWIVGTLILLCWAIMSGGVDEFSSFKKYYLKPAIAVAVFIFIPIA